MTTATVAKVATCVACLLVSFWALKHTHVGHKIGHEAGHVAHKIGHGAGHVVHKIGHEAGHLKMHLARMFGGRRHGHHDEVHRHHGEDQPDYNPSKCNECLAAGKDFCISDNTCIPRATFQCKGPRDHVTGDKEFALHGNPEGIKHLMVCPERPGRTDRHYDHESHRTRARLHQSPGHKEQHDQHHGGSRTFRTALQGGTTQKDCYFDRECHSKVNWEKVAEIKKGFFARLHGLDKEMLAGDRKKVMSSFRNMFLEAGMPDDRIDHILEKWLKSVAFDAKAISKDEKGCYFDEECYEKVHWKQIRKIKEGFMERLKVYRTKSDIHSVREMVTKSSKMFEEAGLPHNRVNHILSKWVKTVYPEAANAAPVFV